MINNLSVCQVCFQPQLGNEHFPLFVHPLTACQHCFQRSTAESSSWYFHKFHLLNHSKHFQNSPQHFLKWKTNFLYQLVANEHSQTNPRSCKIQQPKNPSSTKNTMSGPWVEKKCSGDGETSFSVCCKICAAFPEKMHKSSLFGFKGFSWNIEGFKPEYFTRHVEEEGHKHAQ